MKKLFLQSLILTTFLSLFSSCSKDETSNENKWLSKTVKYAVNNEIYNVKVYFKENGSDFKFDVSTPSQLLDYLDKHSNTLSVALKGDIAYYYSDFNEMINAQNIKIDFNELKKYQASEIVISNLKRVGGGKLTAWNHPFQHYQYNPNDYQSWGTLNYTIGSTTAGSNGYFVSPYVGNNFNDQLTTLQHSNYINGTAQLTISYVDANFGGHSMALFSTNSQAWDLRTVHRVNLGSNWNDCISSMVGYHLG